MYTTQLRERTSELPAWIQPLTAFLFFTVVYGAIYLPVLLGHASLKTNATWPRGPLFVVDPIAGGQITVPLEKLATNAWSHLRLPVVDPYQGYGIPLLATQGIPVFPPEIIVHLLFPHTYSIWNVLRLIIISFGAYLLASSLNQSFYGSLAVGIAAGLVGVVPPNINLGMINPLISLPYMLLCLRMLLDPDKKHGIVYGLGLLTSAAMLALSGFQEVLPLLLLLAAVFSVVMTIHFHTLRYGYRRIVMTLATGLFGLGIGAIGMIPTLDAVAQHMGVNSKGSYLSAVPLSWLATVLVPHVAGRSMIASPQDMGNAVWIMGTPVFLLVIVLAAFATLRVDRSTMWYALPSAVSVVLGILGYYDGLGLLHLFDIFPFNSIIMVRFFEFAWWLPWCLLLGLVISVAPKLRINELVGSSIVAISLDVYLVHRFDVRLHLAHLSNFVAHSQAEMIGSIIVILSFVISCIVSRALKSSVLVFALFTTVSIVLLPKNFFSPIGNTATNSVDTTHPLPAALSVELGMTQLPTYDYSAQVFGPVIPYPYRTVLNALIPPRDTKNGQSVTYLAAPTLYYVRINTRVLQAIRALGANVIISTTPLLKLHDRAIPSCQPGIAVYDHTEGVCFAGKGTTSGTSAPNRLFVYEIPTSSPVIAKFHTVASVTSTKEALSQVINAIDTKGAAGLTDTAYITGVSDRVALAGNSRLIEHQANTESVVDRIRSDSDGLVILRDTYLSGMHCQVNNDHSPCYPVDGGLWTAVAVPRGVSTIKLDYLSEGDLVGFLLALIGMITILAAWLVYGIWGLVLRPRLGAK